MKPLPTSEPPAHRCGDIVAVPFPFSDKLAEKRRPALVVSNAALASDGIVWLVMITSAKQRAMTYDLAILDFAGCGLKVRCVVRPVKIAAVEPSRIIKQIGRLGKKETEIVLARIRSLLGDDPP